MTQRLHPDQLQPGDKVRHYRVVRRLGSGGFSTVFLVEYEGRSFTMKLAARPSGSEAEDEDTTDERAYREAVTLGHFRHPNLPKVHETGRWPDVDSGYFFVVTEYIPASTFNEWRWKTQPCLRRLVEKVAEATRVLADLHERGVVHRDLKADNLLIREGDERLFLTDFGAAYLPGAYPLTEVVAPTTLHNMPPECASFLINGDWEHGVRLPADPVMDLYCIGALLYEALTDCHPFSPKLPQPELLVAIESVVPKQPRLLDPRVPPALNDLTMRLLAKKPERRPATARAVHDELMRLVEAERDSEQWTRPYVFAAREKETVEEEKKEVPEVPPPAVKAEGGRKEPGAPRRRRRGLLVLAILAAVLGVGWGLLRVGCESAFEVACSGAGSTEKGSHPVFSFSEADDTTPPYLSTHRLCLWLGACAAATNLLACASAPVRPNIKALLEECPPEARQTPSRLRLDSIMQVRLANVTCAAPEDICNAVNIRSGPMRGHLILDDENGLIVTGEAKVFPDRVYIYFDRVYPTPDTPALPLCGAVVGSRETGFGLTPVALLPPKSGLNIDPAMVDSSPDATLIDFPVVFTYIQGPGGAWDPQR